MNLFKWLFPMLFLMSAVTAQAQPQAPSGPLYDPQGRLIPYDPPPPDAGEQPRPASKPKAAGKKKSVGPSSKPASSAKGKSKKSATKSSGKASKKGKPASKPSTGKKKAT